MKAYLVLEITKKDHITNLIGRRTIAFLIDIFAIIMSSGVIFERNISLFFSLSFLKLLEVD